MRKATFLFLCLFVCIIINAQKIVSLNKGLIISKTIGITPGAYRINADTSLSKQIMLIEGENIVLDFKHTVLSGSNDKNTPDEFYGVAILIRNSKNITIRNLSVRGYKIAIRAENTEKLIIENCNFSYNYRPHLNSKPEYEDISDWLSFHQNEKDEWLRYSAAIYLRNCNNGIIRNCIITNGQNALLMTGSNNNTINNNFFCFNSGLGIGMYRSSNNQITNNNLDWNVRGYSHGVYQRGQDSAGILLFEQCNNNLIQSNSVTHSGDGLFLWAGQSTMNTGQGGCNDNNIVHNDFSYAPTNGIEVTFSRNTIKHNRIEGCTHGIWGGYSYNTIIEDNYFRNNRIAIAIEHGQHNSITQNSILFDAKADLADKSKTSSGIRLWSNPIEPSDWGYPKYRDTRSTNNSITGNEFGIVDVAVDIKRTDSSMLAANKFGTNKIIQRDSLSTLLPVDETITLFKKVSAEDSYLQKIPKGAVKGSRYILVNEWGPYDFKRPLLILRKQQNDTCEFEIAGPAGKWKIHALKNVRLLSASQQTVPGTIRVVTDNKNDYNIALVYTGEAVTDEFGKQTAKGKPYLFSYNNWQVPAKWNVQWFAADSSLNPYNDNDAFQKLIGGTATTKSEQQHIRFNWWGSPAKGIPADYFATVAETTIELKTDSYDLDISSDDGVRIYVDGEIIINTWDQALFKGSDLPHFRKKITLQKGNHHFRIEHYELKGFSCLTFSLQKSH